MKEYTGWLLDLYAHPKQGIILWLVGEDKRPHSFHQQFPITFYVGGPFHRLRHEDTPLLIAEAQLQILQILSKEKDPSGGKRSSPLG